MNEGDQREARVRDPATCNRYVVVWHNPSTNEKWLVAAANPQEVGRFKEALIAQGCWIVIANDEMGEWSSWRWLLHYRKDAPLQEIGLKLRAIGVRGVLLH